MKIVLEIEYSIDGELTDGINVFDLIIDKIPNVILSESIDKNNEDFAVEILSITQIGE